MARRYLVHAEQQAYPAGDPRRDDVTKILGLALAFGDLRSDPDLLAALWNVEDPLAEFRDLARRHDFVLPVSRCLHDDVRDTLHTDLLDAYRRARARQINQRALALFDARLGQMRHRWPGLDEQLDHTEFTTALLAALWHTLWVDNQAGLDLFIRVLPVLAVADLPTADAAAAMMEQFAATFDQDQRHALELLTQIQPSELEDYAAAVSGADHRVTRQVKITLPGLALHPPGPATDDPLMGEPGDRQVAVMFLRASLQADDNEATVATLRTAAAQTASTRLKQAIATRILFWAVNSDVEAQVRAEIEDAKGKFRGSGDLRGEEIPTFDSLEKALWNAPGLPQRLKHIVAFRAFSKLPREVKRELPPSSWLQVVLGAGSDGTDANRDSLRYAWAWHTYGLDLSSTGRFEDALAAYDRALALDPDDFCAHSNRGAALLALGRFEDALAAFDRALALDPDNAAIHTNRGAALHALGRFEDALAAFDRALALDPGFAAAHENKGIVMAVIGDFDRALAELDAASRLAPTGAGAGSAWAGAILWHRRDTAGACDRFALVKSRVTGQLPPRAPFPQDSV